MKQQSALSMFIEQSIQRKVNEVAALNAGVISARVLADAVVSDLEKAGAYGTDIIGIMDGDLRTCDGYCHGDDY